MECCLCFFFALRLPERVGLPQGQSSHHLIKRSYKGALYQMMPSDSSKNFSRPQNRRRRRHHHCHDSQGPRGGGSGNRRHGWNWRIGVDRCQCGSHRHCRHRGVYNLGCGRRWRGGFAAQPGGPLAAAVPGVHGGGGPDADASASAVAAAVRETAASSRAQTAGRG